LYGPVGSCRTRSRVEIYLRVVIQVDISPGQPYAAAITASPGKVDHHFPYAGQGGRDGRGPEGVWPRNRRQWRGSAKTTIYCSWLEHIRTLRRVIGSYHCRLGALVWKSPFRIAVRRPSAHLRLRPMPRRGSPSTRTASRHKAREPAGSAGRGREPIRQPDDRESRAIMVVTSGARLELRRLPLWLAELGECADGL
jgi:hypothetical protein